ncbi:hypothetical protein RSAG8_10841, partial [Rhizoctonia solani AG-8 WAC10335]
MSGLLSQLPVEIRTLVFGRLPWRDLTSASLVCRTWQILVFPCLYHTIRLSDITHLKVLAERLLVNDAPNSLSVPIHLRCLKLDSLGRIRNMDTHYFDIIIPKLTRLNCLYWELNFMPNNFRWFSACPELKSVHLLPHIMDIEEEWIERLPQLLQFTNLTHFSLECYDLPHEFNKYKDKYIEPLTSILRSSPNLETIILNLEGDYAPYSPTLILEPLGDQFTFPWLHTFHVLGNVDPGWFEFMSKATHPLRTFLARHPAIRDLGIGCPVDDMPSGGMDLDELSQLLPSVKHLACPLFLCEVVVTSKLATQIESLAISNPCPGNPNGNPFDPIFQAMTEDSLPNLRKLAIWHNLGRYWLRGKDLEPFFLAAKGLEELELRTSLEDYDGFLSALGGAKNLRQIKVNHNQIWVHGTPAGKWEPIMLRLAERCPLLEMIVDYHGTHPLRFVRDDSGQPSIVKIEHGLL